MIQFINYKILFFFLDLISLVIYLIIIINNKFYKYFLLTLFFGATCMLTSLINITNIYSNAININHFNLIYLIARTYIFIIEWLQYLVFLKLIKENKIKKVILTMLFSSIFIHLHYYFIECYEISILGVNQYISPFDLLLKNMN